MCALCVLVLPALLSACVANDPREASDSDAIVSLSDGEVNAQEIGNCWAFASTSWLEAQHFSATGERVDLSESYLTYWMLFTRLALPRAYPDVTTVAPGATWNEVDLILRNYGVVSKTQFLPEDQRGANAQRVALAYVNKWLRKGGMQRAPSNAAERRVVLRRMLDKAFGLRSEVVADMDAQFGDATLRSFVVDAFVESVAPRIQSPGAFLISVPDEATGELKPVPLREALGTAEVFEVLGFPKQGSAEEVREFFRRIQKTLHAGVPLYIAWYADSSAESAAGEFRQSQIPAGGSKLDGVGSHASLIVDYEATLANGTVHRAGEEATDPGVLQSLLSESTAVNFLRVKNSWGARSNSSPTPSGYNDLYLDYLLGPNPMCRDEQGTVASGVCPRAPYLKSVVALRERPPVLASTIGPPL